MRALVVGATGKTGRPLVEELLGRGHAVCAIVRSPEKLPAAVREHPNAQVVRAPLLDLSDEALAEHTRGCEAVISCLGHVLSFKGMYGAPRQLCTDAVRRLCQAIESNDEARPTRFILMNTVGVPNPELNEKRGWVERCVLTMLRYLVPPHRDNETAAAYLHEQVGSSNPHVEWCTVRPDTLIDAAVTPYDVVPSPTTPLFSGRPTTRANVAHFMADLIEQDELWRTWKFQRPVIMNAEVPA